MMQAFGVHYKSAGENIGWVSGRAQAPAAAELHQRRIHEQPRPPLQHPRRRNYTEMGVGSDESAPGVIWTGVSPGQQNVWMFSEEFAQVGASSPPPPRKTPKPGPGGGRTRPHPGRLPWCRWLPRRPPRRRRRRRPSPSRPAAFPRTSRPRRSPSTKASSPTASNPFSKHFCSLSKRAMNPDSAQHRRSVHGRRSTAASSSPRVSTRSTGSAGRRARRSGTSH